MKIIKNGKEKTFFCKCHECATEFEYNYNDIYIPEENGLKFKFVDCPVCGAKEYVTFQTKEEFDIFKNFPTYNYFGCGCKANV